MNEFLTSDLIQKLSIQLGVASEFVVAAIWERVYFGAYWAGVWVVLFSVLGVMAYRGGCRFQRYAKEHDPRNDFGPAPAIVKYGVSCVMLFIALTQVRVILMVMLAPNYAFLWRLKMLLEQ